MSGRRNIQCNWCGLAVTGRPHAWVKTIPVCTDCLYESPDWGALLVVSIFAQRPSWHKLPVS